MYIWLHIIQTNIFVLHYHIYELVFYRSITVYLRFFYHVISLHYFWSTVFIINCCYCFKVSHVTRCACYYVMTVIKPKTNYQLNVVECVCLCSEGFGVQLSSQLNQTQCCQWLAIVATFLRKAREAVLSQTQWRGDGPHKLDIRFGVMQRV